MITTPPQFPDLTLALSRSVPLSPEQCFDAWTIPERLMPWFCPRPWRVVACAIDLRPGGVFSTTMQSPEGETLPEGDGCILAVEAPHRLVWTNMLGPGFRPQVIAHPGFAFVCDLRFDRLPDGGTHYQAFVHHLDTAGRDAHAAMGFHEGWGIALDQLVEFVSKGQEAGPIAV
jgi:uncharacterized protein YndB with AHSA1/START domain